MAAQSLGAHSLSLSCDGLRFWLASRPLARAGFPQRLQSAAAAQSRVPASRYLTLHISIVPLAGLPGGAPHVLKNELLQYLCPEGGRTRPAVRRRSDTSPSAVIGPSRSAPPPQSPSLMPASRAPACRGRCRAACRPSPRPRRRRPTGRTLTCGGNERKCQRDTSHMGTKST